MLVAALKTNDKKAMLEHPRERREAADRFRRSGRRSQRAGRASSKSYDQAHKLVMATATARSCRSVPTNGRSRFRSSNTMAAGISIRRRASRRSSTGASAATSSTRSRRAWRTSTRSASTISPTRRTSKLAQYAQHAASTPGKHDGLYWPTKEGETPSPLGPFIARARGEGYKKAGTGAGVPYHGYYYKRPQGAGARRAGRRLRLHGARRHAGWVRARRVSGRVRQLGRDDIHRQPRRCRLREGSRSEERRDGARDDAVQSRRTWKRAPVAAEGTAERRAARPARSA